MRRLTLLLPGFLAYAIYLAGVASMNGVPKPDLKAITPVALPLPMQIVLGGGDRYLAANIGSFRTVVNFAEIADGKEAAAFAAKVQRDVAWLNPGHEDNYYLAAGFLSGSVHHETAQTVLAAAADARPFDFQPAFFHAVNLVHYEQRFVEASQWMSRAATVAADEQNREFLTRIAVRWAQRGEDPARVAEMLEAMAEASRSRALRDYTLKRAQQARLLAKLNGNVRQFVEKTGRSPQRLEELVEQGILDALPEDPVGAGFSLDSSGRPTVGTTRRETGK